MLPSSSRWPLVVLAVTFPGAGALRAAEATEVRTGDVVKVRFALDAEGDPDRAAAPQATVVGTLAEIEADALVVAGPSGRVRRPRAAIEDLQVKRGRSRGRAALIGAGVGADCFGLERQERTVCRLCDPVQGGGGVRQPV